MDLSPRLFKIASLVDKCSCLADVGTDHGYVPLYLLKNKKIDHAIAMDINKMPLERAKTNIVGEGYGEKCEFRLSDGIEKLKKGEADTIVIAGMGGLLMRDIIDKSTELIDNNTRLLLQPMIAPAELRLYLYENDFIIDNEYVVREENKFYNIFSVIRGMASYSAEDIYIGKNLKLNSPDNFYDYIAYKLRVCEKIIAGMKLSKKCDKKELERKINEAKIYASAIDRG